ncbi:distal tail protein Dit [Bacillus phage 000TH010]|uniref:Distal tail protein n=1 Tax=Bacillus phage 000TH010 TaxID=2601652 RepID=A0A5P8PHU3_9CAUD|nr:distal tail protein Dit [Bacillus phage 000TH010]QFR56239.1 distal tail protein [Bacillus phage 000TH010]
MNIYDILGKVFTMMYDGQDLTDYFLVQEVRGRSVYSKEMGKRTIAGVDGGTVTTENLPARTLEVYAVVFSDGTETDLRHRIEYLNFLLHRDYDVPITFSDEPDRTYYGRYEFASEGDEKGGFHKVTLNFYCEDPLKHGPEVTVDVATESTPVKNTGLAATNPAIRCVFSTSATEYELQLLNGSTVVKFLKVRYGFNTGDTLVIDCHEREVTLNGQDIMPALLMQSDWIQLKPQVNTYLKATQPSTIVFTEKFL